MEQMAARRYSEIAVHQAALAAWRERTVATAIAVTTGEPDHAVVAALNAMVMDAGPDAEDGLDYNDDVFYDTAAVVAARREDVAMAVRTRINTDANASTEAASYFRAMVGAGLGHLIARRSAATGIELQHIDGLQQDLRDTAVGVTRKRGVGGMSALGCARTEQARRERMSSSAVSFEVSLSVCFHAVAQISAGEQEAAWEAACGGPGARWSQASQASDKRQCVQAAGVQQQQAIFSASTIYNVGVGGGQKRRRPSKRGKGSQQRQQHRQQSSLSGNGTS